MNRKLQINEIRLAKINKTNQYTFVFAYNFKSEEAICGTMNYKHKSFQLSEIPLIKLTFYNQTQLHNLIDSEKDNNQDLIAGLAYLINVGIDNKNWDYSWGLFHWKSMDENGNLNVYKQKV